MQGNVDAVLNAFQFAVLVVFLLVFVGRTFYLLGVRRINPIVIGAGKKGIQRIIELLFPIWLLLATIEITRSALSLEIQILPALFYIQVLDWMPARITGVIAIGLSLFLFIAALIPFGDSWRVGIDERRPGELITGGVFSWSRNPIFLFMDLYAIGTFLLNGTLVFLMMGLALIGALHYQILQEERFLRQRYGAAYETYSARTARYFGRKQAPIP